IGGRLSRRQLEDRLIYARRDVDACGRRLSACLRASNRRKGEELARAAGRLNHRPLERIAANARQRLDGTWRLVSSLSHRSVLSRGFALLRDASGNAVTSAGQLSPGEAFTAELNDGTIEATVKARGSADAPRITKPARKSPPPGQGDLF
nr:exodeoxyribonuclease VII large subunit [Nitratireductor sp.]